MSELVDVFEDAFNLLAGKLIGEGVYRKVYTCKLRPDLVVKVEEPPASGYRTFHNVEEWLFWNNNEYNKKVAKWLAPITYISPDAHIVLQARVQPIQESEREKLPRMVPAFLTDMKYGNYGWLNGQLVCCDYGSAIESPSLKLKKSDWWE